MDVWISFKGTQQIDNDSNTFEFDTRGTLKRTEDGYRISYDESKTIGIDGVFTTIHVNQTSVLLERQGSINSVLVLEKDKRTLSNYDIGEGSLTMGVYATEVDSQIKDKGGDLKFKYTLDIESTVTSSHEVYVSVEEL